MIKDKKQAFKSESRFLKAFIFTVVFLSFITILFNIMIDPFGVVGAPAFEGINKKKPSMYNNARMVKAYTIRRIKPRGLILGTSRSELGYDSGHPGWAENSLPVYNLALPSAHIFEEFCYLQHANTQRHLSQVVLGLDFFSFDANRPNEEGFTLKRLDIDNSFKPNIYMIKDLVTALYSISAVSASFETIYEQKSVSNGYLRNGNLSTENWDENIKAKGGYFLSFEQRLRSTLISEDGITKLDYGNGNGEKVESLFWFREFVSFCLKENIELYILISPLHVKWLEMMKLVGIWGDYEQWKKDVTQIVESEVAESKTSLVVELWDFSGINSITTERVPEKNDSSSEMQWYWEASHFKRAVGDMMFDRIFLGIKGGSPPDFGVRLTNKNIDLHLKQFRDKLHRFEIKNPYDIKYLKNLITSTLYKNTDQQI